MTHTRIIIDVQGGAVQSVYGDLLPDGVNVEIILRDHDNIEAGDPDPMPEDYKPATNYW
jgi:hypothetical protein